MRGSRITPGAIVMAALLSLGAAGADEARKLSFAPLAGAKAGESARYRLRILDASGREVSASEKSYRIDAVEEGEARIGKITLAGDADAPAIIAALRMLPPGTPTDGMTESAAKAKGPDGRERDVRKLSLSGTLRDGVTKVKAEFLFAEAIPVFGLLKADVRIDGGGAGGSVWEYLGE